MIDLPWTNPLDDLQLSIEVKAPREAFRVAWPRSTVGTKGIGRSSVLHFGSPNPDFGWKG